MFNNPWWDPREADKPRGKHPCNHCPHEQGCSLLGMEHSCESFALMEKKALDRMNNKKRA